MSPTALDAAVGVEHHAQRGQRVATGPMVDVHAAPLRLDQAGVAQLSQMMTDCRFAHPQGASKAAAGTVIPEGTGCVNRVAGLWFCWLSASG